MNIDQKLNKEISIIFKTSKNINADRVGSLTFNDFLSNKLLMISAIRQGVSYALFDLIKNSAPFTESEWAEFLNISSKSLQRYKQTSKQFKPIQSEKIIEMAEVTKVGREVFGSLEKFKMWLDTPNFALGNMKPKELLKDSYGKEMVIGELIRIEHGTFV